MSMSITTEANLDKVVSILVQAYAPVRLYLFGSRARGDANADSDTDLLLVVPDDASAPRRRARLAYESLRGTGIAVDVLVWTRSEFDKRLHLRSSLPATVVREGRVVYEA